MLSYEERCNVVIQVRTCEYKKNLIKQAAHKKDSSMSQFVVNAAFNEAKVVLKMEL